MALYHGFYAFGVLSPIPRIDINELGVEMRFKEELKRHNKFQRTVLGLAKPGTAHEDVDLRTYAKYILKEGTNEERRGLMGCFKSRLKITKGVIAIH